jgi:hypothetical protein
LTVLSDDYFPESQPSFNIQQQKRQIAGIVTDAKGEAVIGANIIEKGTTNGTVTDNNGGFSLTLENDGILQISYIGYLTQEVNTVGQTTVTDNPAGRYAGPGRTGCGGLRNHEKKVT